MFGREISESTSLAKALNSVSLELQEEWSGSDVTILMIPVKQGDFSIMASNGQKLFDMHGDSYEMVGISGIGTGDVTIDYGNGNLNITGIGGEIELTEYHGNQTAESIVRVTEGNSLSVSCEDMTDYVQY